MTRQDAGGVRDNATGLSEVGALKEHLFGEHLHLINVVIDPESREDGYRCFITSLKRLATYAPAFTSLGVYYADYRSPPDPNRASKCFQKAFELDPREAEAARRLAEGFAEEREWDLVEVVARRTIDGEGGLEGGSEGAVTTRYQPLNAWAWKAVGVVELVRSPLSASVSRIELLLSEPRSLSSGYTSFPGRSAQRPGRPTLLAASWRSVQQSVPHGSSSEGAGARSRAEARRLDLRVLPR